MVEVMVLVVARFLVMILLTVVKRFFVVVSVEVSVMVEPGRVIVIGSGPGKVGVGQSTSRRWELGVSY